MTLAPGDSLARYRITAKLGEGGMGEVWRATDARLKREVAIKVLPAAFTADGERLARFEREAQLLAQLHHPNIASVFGLEEADGVRALVLELVEGPTLAERLERGPLAVEECLTVSLQIAQALEEAHDKGIVHRDLKPHNVKASVEGRVKVLDFGLAKAMDPLAGASGGTSASRLAASPTMTMGATVQGMILGTAAYMAPEQAKGFAVDKRADIWAFGVVLYEMLTGTSPFTGDSVADTLARVLRRDVDFDLLPAATPPEVRRLLRRCLERNPRRRLHDVADARIVIEDAIAGDLEEPRVAAATTGRGARRLLPWLGGALAGLALGVLLAPRFAAPSATAPQGATTTMRTLVAAGVSVDPSVARDGRTLAFTSQRDGTVRVWIKDLATGSESVLARAPSWAPVFAPDGTSLLFSTAEGDRADLYRISLATREERLVARDVESADWSPDGRSVLISRRVGDAAEPSVELSIVELDSGRGRAVRRGALRTLDRPRWSPDGERVAIQVGASQLQMFDRLGILTLATGDIVEHPLALPGVPELVVHDMLWLDPERLLLLLNDGSEAIQMAGRIALYHLAARRLESLLPLPATGMGFDVAGPGSVIVSLGSWEQNLHEHRRGAGGDWSEARRVTEGPFRDRQPAYSPDGAWLLFSSNRSGNLDLWRFGRETGELQRLTDHPATDWDPATSPDGRQLLFSSDRSGRFQVWIAEADGSSPRQVTDFEDAQNPTMTADGRWIVFSRQDAPDGQNGVWKVRPDGSGATLVVAGPLRHPEASAAGELVAFSPPGWEDVRRLARLGDGRRLDGPQGTARHRWSLGPRLFLWALVDGEPGRAIARWPVDPDSGALGPLEVLPAADPDYTYETLGVARDGSAFAYSSNANRRAQILRIDGLAGVEPR
ncbi:MAG TPA: protein kinase [Thermoanaerobaculia bacterium]|nr:protein kinase [Thermoanaerobaculia bacterium]